MGYLEHSDWTRGSAKDELLVSTEYEAGYQARVEGLDEYRTATSSGRSGWSDADHDLQTGVLTNCSGRFEDTYSNWSTFGSGCYARSCELPFDLQSDCNWKREWVLADIALGIAAKKGRA